ncbi:MAG: TrmH family RNA methyltransferase, partial [Pseudomonadota bacterium]
MIDIVLFEPEIPQNTGNLIRLAANTGYQLCLIEPLAFHMDEKRLRRAGLDYREFAEVYTFASWDTYRSERKPRRIWAFSSKVTRRYTEARFARGDALLFGPESRGLPAWVLDSVPSQQHLTLPMRTGGRSLNLANAAAIATYESWRQLNFD